MSSSLSRLLNAQAPVRSGILSLIKRAKIGNYPFRLSLGALERPHYAHIAFNAAQLAKRLGYSRISIIEYGVAGGLGLICLEEHAREIAKIFAIEIDVYGFDTGKGLPRPRDYRDLPYHWKEGFFAMDFDKLQKRLRKARLVLGDISETAPSFFEQYRPAPIGAIAHDFDFYSSTAVALRMLAAGEEHFLPRVFCYFDDTMGTAIELYNDSRASGWQSMSSIGRTSTSSLASRTTCWQRVVQAAEPAAAEAPVWRAARTESRRRRNRHYVEPAGRARRKSLAFGGRQARRAGSTDGRTALCVEQDCAAQRRPARPSGSAVVAGGW